MKKDSLIDSISCFLVKGPAWLAQHLPIGVALALGRAGGAVVWFFHNRKRVAYANLKAAFGAEKSAHELRRIVFQMYTSMGETGVELMRFPMMTREENLRTVHVSGEENIPQALEKGKGMIYLSAHFGNWELPAQTSQFHGYPTTILARDQKYSRVNDLLNTYRTSHGIGVFAKGFTLRELVRALKNNKTVGILGDQSGGSNGVYATFFGRKTSSAPGAIELAMRIGCTILPTFIYRVKGPHHEIHVHPPLELSQTSDHEKGVQESLQRYLNILEGYIRRFPHQWLWGHKRWKHCRSKRLLVLSDGKAGHLVQSQSVVGQLKQLYLEWDPANEFEVKTAEIRFKNSLARFLFDVAFVFLYPFIQGRLHWLSPFLTTESLRAIACEHTDLIVSCGSSLAGINLLLAKENLAKSLVLMKPPFPYPPFHYSLILIPQHDSAPALRNVFQTRLTPNLASPVRLRQEAEQLNQRIGLRAGKIYSFFIGGDTRRYHFSTSLFLETLVALKRVITQEDAQLLITTSRRTRPDIVQMIKKEFKEFSPCKLLVIASEHNPPNVTYGMLGLSGRVVVTEDSISMVSEAVSSRKPVTVVCVGLKPPSRKHVRFLESLRHEDLVTVCTPEGLEESLLKRRGDVWSSVLQQEEEGLRKRLERAFR